MQSLIRSKSAGVTGGRGTAGAGPGRDLLYKKHTEQCGYDHAPVTRGRMRAQFPLPHGPCISYALVQATVGVGTVIIVYVILITYKM